MLTFILDRSALSMRRAFAGAHARRATARYIRSARAAHYRVSSVSYRPAAELYIVTVQRGGAQ